MSVASEQTIVEKELYVLIGNVWEEKFVRLTAAGKTELKLKMFDSPAASSPNLWFSIPTNGFTVCENAAATFEGRPDVFTISVANGAKSDRGVVTSSWSGDVTLSCKVRKVWVETLEAIIKMVNQPSNKKAAAPAADAASAPAPTPTSALSPAEPSGTREGIKQSSSSSSSSSSAAAASSSSSSSSSSPSSSPPPLSSSAALIPPSSSLASSSAPSPRTPPQQPSSPPSSPTPLSPSSPPSPTSSSPLPRADAVGGLTAVETTNARSAFHKNKDPQSGVMGKDAFKKLVRTLLKEQQQQPTRSPSPKPPTDKDLGCAFKLADVDGSKSLDEGEFLVLFSKIKAGEVHGLGAGRGVFGFMASSSALKQKNVKAARLKAATKAAKAREQTEATAAAATAEAAAAAAAAAAEMAAAAGAGVGAGAAEVDERGEGEEHKGDAEEEEKTSTDQVPASPPNRSHPLSPAASLATIREGEGEGNEPSPQLSTPPSSADKASNGGGGLWSPDTLESLTLPSPPPAPPTLAPSTALSSPPSSPVTLESAASPPPPSSLSFPSPPPASNTHLAAHSPPLAADAAAAAAQALPTTPSVEEVVTPPTTTEPPTPTLVAPPPTPATSTLPAIPTPASTAPAIPTVANTTAVNTTAATPTAVSTAAVSTTAAHSPPQEAAAAAAAVAAALTATAPPLAGTSPIAASPTLVATPPTPSTPTPPALPTPASAPTTPVSTATASGASGSPPPSSGLASSAQVTMANLGEVNPALAAKIEEAQRAALTPKTPKTRGAATTPTSSTSSSSSSSSSSKLSSFMATVSPTAAAASAAAATSPLPAAAATAATAATAETAPPLETSAASPCTPVPRTSSVPFPSPEVETTSADGSSGHGSHGEDDREDREDLVFEWPLEDRYAGQDDEGSMMRWPSEDRVPTLLSVEAASSGGGEGMRQESIKEEEEEEEEGEEEGEGEENKPEKEEDTPAAAASAVAAAAAKRKAQAAAAAAASAAAEVEVAAAAAAVSAAVEVEMEVAAAGALEVGPSKEAPAAAAAVSASAVVVGDKEPLQQQPSSAEKRKSSRTELARAKSLEVIFKAMQETGDGEASHTVSPTVAASAAAYAARAATAAALVAAAATAAAEEEEEKTKKAAEEARAVAGEEHGGGGGVGVSAPWAATAAAFVAAAAEEEEKAKNAAAEATSTAMMKKKGVQLSVPETAEEKAEKRELARRRSAESIRIALARLDHGSTSSEEEEEEEEEEQKEETVDDADVNEEEDERLLLEAQESNDEELRQSESLRRVSSSGLLDAVLPKVLNVEDLYDNQRFAHQGERSSDYSFFCLKRRYLVLLLPLLLVVWSALLPSAFTSRVSAFGLPFLLDNYLTSPTGAYVTAAILQQSSSSSSSSSSLSSLSIASLSQDEQGTRPLVLHPYSGKVAVVTGCSLGGIGFETAAALAGQVGMVVVCAGRGAGGKGAKAAQAIAKRWPDAKPVVPMECDLSSFASVRSFVREFNKRFSGKKHPLPLLVNNAGVLAPMPYGVSADADGHEQQMATNHLGHYLLTALLLPRLKQASLSTDLTVATAVAKKQTRNGEEDGEEGAVPSVFQLGSRVVYVASRAHALDFGEGSGESVGQQLVSHQSGGSAGYSSSVGALRAYARTKKFNILSAMALSAQQQGSGRGSGGGGGGARGGSLVSAYSVCPGVAKTHLHRGPGKSNWLAWLGYELPPMRWLLKSPSQGAHGPLFAALHVHTNPHQQQGQRRRSYTIGGGGGGGGGVLEVVKSGSYLVGTSVSEAAGVSEALALELWEASAVAVGLSKSERKAALA